MSFIGSTIRFFLGLFLSIEIIRQFNNVPDFLFVVSVIYLLLAIAFFIEKDMKGAKSYARFFVAFIMSLTIIFYSLIDNEFSSIATILASFYFLMALWFFAKKSGLIRF